MPDIRVYGTDWCEDTERSRKLLDERGIKYLYINIEKDPTAQRWVVAQNHGKQKTPTIDIGTTILIEPSDVALESVLIRQGILKT